MQQVYVTNFERVEETQQGQEYELHRIAEWLQVLVEEMRYANAMTRAKFDGRNSAWLKEQGY